MIVESTAVLQLTHPKDSHEKFQLLVESEYIFFNGVRARVEMPWHIGVSDCSISEEISNFFPFLP